MGTTFEIEAFSYRDMTQFEDKWISIWMGNDGFKAMEALFQYKKRYSAVRLIWRAPIA